MPGSAAAVWRAQRQLRGMLISSGPLRAATAAWTASKWLLMVLLSQALTLKQAGEDREPQIGSRTMIRIRTHSGALLLC